MSRDLIAEASTALAAALSTEGEVSALYLANARVSLAGAKEQCAQLERVVAAREAEAVRIAKLADRGEG